VELIEKIIKTFSPKAAANRELWRQRASRLYEAAANSAYHKRPKVQGSANKSMDTARGRVRDWARTLDENHDIAIGVLDELVNKVVGTGITLEPLAASSTGKLNKKLNREISKLWRRWCKAPEVTGELPFSEVQRLAARTMFKDGEILSQHILGTKAGLIHAGGLPYTIEMIEADFLPFEFNDAKRGIVHGVELDTWGKPRAYHLLKTAPDNGIPFFIKPRPQDLKRVLAENISHLKFTRRFKQTRGISIFHGVAHRLDDIKDYEESERIAARVGASFTAYIKKGSDFVDDVDATKTNREMEFAAGMIFDDLLPGEEIGTIDTNRPNTELLNFRNSQLRAVAAGTGTSYSSIAKSYDGTYSAQRQELVESVPGYSRLRDYFIAAFLEKVYQNFITAAMLSGAIVVPKSVDPATLIEAAWIAPPMSWIDPKKEIEADALAVQNKFKTRAQVIRDRTGRDPDIVNEQIKAEQIELDLQTPKPKPSKPASPPAAEDEDTSEAA